MSVQVGSSCEDNITWHFLPSCMLAHPTALLSEELRCRRARTETGESTERGYGPGRAGGKGEVQQEGAQVQKKGSHLQKNCSKVQ